jgi:iron(III) transport system substrate-binding protein
MHSTYKGCKQSSAWKRLFKLALLALTLSWTARAAFAATAATDWERVIAAAEQEGRVVIVLPLGEAYPRVVAAFQKSFPRIKVETFSSHTRDFIPRFRAERAAGQILWDILINGPDTSTYAAAHQGFWDPVLPELLLPEVRDNSKWRGGLKNAFSDKGKTFAFNFVMRTTEGFFVNRDFVPESELPSVDGWWNSKWAGKIAWHDPRGVGTGTTAGLVILVSYGEKALKDLWSSQRVVVLRDQRQLIEWTVRGRYPIAAGLIPRELRASFHPHGLGLNVHSLPQPGLIAANPGSNSLVLINKAPHPNARKVFLNWLLSQKGQAAVVEEVKENSLRNDVAVPDPERLPPEGKAIMNPQSEEMAPLRSRVNEIAREIFR